MNQENPLSSKVDNYGIHRYYKGFTYGIITGLATGFVIGFAYGFSKK